MLGFYLLSSLPSVPSCIWDGTHCSSNGWTDDKIPPALICPADSPDRAEAVMHKICLARICEPGINIYGSVVAQYGRRCAGTEFGCHATEPRAKPASVSCKNRG